jgi:methionyl-tRNA synthetase
MSFADRVNQYFDQHKPWELAKNERQHNLLHIIASECIAAFHTMTILLKPMLPDLARRAEEFLQTPGLAWEHLGTRPTKVAAYKHLMSRVEPRQLDALFEVPQEPPPGAEAATTVSPSTPVAKPEPAATIGIDDFAKLDLRVARIVKAEHVQGAEKLLKLLLDLGTETRTVFAGIKGAYDPAKLEGRLTVMVANLAPRKMKFGVSEGMVLAASWDTTAGGSQGIFLVAPDEGAEPGMRVK